MIYVYDYLVNVEKGTWSSTRLRFPVEADEVPFEEVRKFIELTEGIDPLRTRWAIVCPDRYGVDMPYYERISRSTMARHFFEVCSPGFAGAPYVRKSLLVTAYYRPKEVFWELCPVPLLRGLFREWTESEVLSPFMGFFEQEMALRRAPPKEVKPSKDVPRFERKEIL